MIKRMTLLLGLCFFASNIMGSGDATEVSNQSSHSKIIIGERLKRNLAAYACGFVSPAVGILITCGEPGVPIAGLLGFVGYSGGSACLYHLRVRNLSQQNNISFDATRSKVNMGLNYAAGVVSCLTLLFCL
jgi:hypothetical protein